MQELSAVNGGELYYKHYLCHRAAPVDRNICHAVVRNDYIALFLDDDIDRCKLKKWEFEDLKRTRCMMAASSRMFNLYRQFEAKSAKTMLNVRIGQIKERIASFKSSIRKQTEELSYSVDSKIGDCLKEYFRILKSDTDKARYVMGKRDNALRIQYELAKVKREIMLFSVQLRDETGGIVQLLYLDRSSAQYQRCEKAVIDNVAKECPFDVHVLNVLKLENVSLMKSLQVHIY